MLLMNSAFPLIIVIGFMIFSYQCMFKVFCNLKENDQAQIMNHKWESNGNYIYWKVKDNISGSVTILSQTWTKNVKKSLREHASDVCHLVEGTVECGRQSCW